MPRTDPPPAAPAATDNHYFRFHAQNAPLQSAFGNDWFALRAEAFARFFGTPKFLIGQTLFVAAWVLVNATGLVKFDVYPFILLNLAFSLQSAYAAPLILLAQTRQADRDKVTAEADAKHREDLAMASQKRQAQVETQTAMLLELVQQNTQLTEAVKDLIERVEGLTKDMHKALCLSDGPNETPADARKPKGPSSPR